MILFTCCVLYSLELLSLHRHCSAMHWIPVQSIPISITKKCPI